VIPVELYQLQSFLQVAEEGSITRAAETLSLTQPAVTQHVQALERELSARLFDRTGRGVRLTAAGLELQRYARRSLALLSECRDVLRDLDAGTSGRIVLGAGVTTSIFHLPGLLRAFQEQYPGIDVVVRTGRTREVTALALDRQIDLGLITSGVDHPDLRVADLFDEEIALVVPSGHPLAGRSIPAEAIGTLPLILFPEGTGFRSYLGRALGTAGIPLRVKMESDSAEAIKSFVEVGLGASFLPLAAVRAELEGGSLALVTVEELPPLHRKTAVLYRMDRYLSAGARGFLQLLLDRYQATA
jgi:DNA-binding transcriptional LysR family regulator